MAVQQRACLSPYCSSDSGASCGDLEGSKVRGLAKHIFISFESIHRAHKCAPNTPQRLQKHLTRVFTLASVRLDYSWRLRRLTLRRKGYLPRPRRRPGGAPGKEPSMIATAMAAKKAANKVRVPDSKGFSTSVLALWTFWSRLSLSVVLANWIDVFFNVYQQLTGLACIKINVSLSQISLRF